MYVCANFYEQCTIILDIYIDILSYCAKVSMLRAIDETKALPGYSWLLGLKYKYWHYTSSLWYTMNACTINS